MWRWDICCSFRVGSRCSCVFSAVINTESNGIWRPAEAGVHLGEALRGSGKKLKRKSFPLCWKVSAPPTYSNVPTDKMDPGSNVSSGLRILRPQPDPRRRVGWMVNGWMVNL